MSSDNRRIMLFQNPWLEWLTVISPVGFIAIWALIIPAVCYAAWGAADLATGLGLLIVGLLVWSLFEYAMHRHVFHWQPRWAPLAKLTHLIHGNHHAMPNDPLRNLMPPLVSIPIIGSMGAVSLAIIGTAGFWTILGIVIGYVFYDLVHYSCHQLPMKGPLARIFKQHHMRHHHARQDGNYAITGMMWDRLFSTQITSLKR